MKTYKYLFYQLKKCKKSFLLAALLAVMFQLLILISGIVSQKIFSNITTHPNKSYLIILLIILSGCPILNLFVGQVVLYLSETFKNKVGKKLRLELLNGSLISSKFKSIDSSGVICVFRDDVNDVCNCLADFISALSMTIFTIVAIGIMLKINVIFTISTVIPIFAIVFVIKILENEISKYQENVRKATTDINSFIGQIFSSIQTIKIFNSGLEMVSKLKSLNKHRKKAIIKSKMFGETLIQISGSLVHLALAVILLIGIKYFKSGSFFIGEFALFEYYFWFIGATFPTVVVQFYKSYKQLSVSVKRIGEITFFDQNKKALVKKPIDYNITNFKSLLLKDLKYKNDSKGIKINLSDIKINRNSLTVITGETGSGKTTLLKLLAGLIESDIRLIVLDEKIKVNNLLEETKNFIGYVSQVPNFIDGTVKENILMGLNEKEVNFEKILYLSCLDKDIEEFSEGLYKNIGINGSMLSGGQRKRLAIARALALDPKILVIDDLSSSVDVETEKQIWDRLLNQKQYTYILSSHRKTAIDSADNVLKLSNKEILITRRIY